MKGIKVLSCFDGMSCGRIALERADIPVEKYYASEIDKYAITIAQKNYPDTIQLGNITKWQEWDIEQPDMIIGGSPCQGFSFAGKQLNFDDPRSKLFFVFADILRHYKPKYFLLENVRMKKEYQNVISECLGVEPIMINSALVSAQNRKRLYWTNIEGITQPEDKGIILKDILEEGIVDKEKSFCLDANYHKGLDCHQQRMGVAIIANVNPSNRGMNGNIIDKDSLKSPNLTTNKGEGIKIGCIQIGEADLKGRDIIKRVYSEEGKSPSMATCGGGNREPKVAINKRKRGKNMGGIITDKTPSLTANCWQENNHLALDNITWRKLTPVECERLQTLPDNYTAGVSNSQRYKMIGNGWTVDVIAHIFSNLS
jgi:DNA-cytosine methyltransferase